jgi:secreted trypsin-like serine protease
MHRLRVLIVTLLLIALLPVSASAVTNGELDAGGEYPFVGLLAFYDGDGEYLHRCSGTLISPKVMVTASHCTDGTVSARALFGLEITEDFRMGVGGTTGTPHTHPGYNPRTVELDVAVVELDWPAPVAGPFPTLPGQGFLTELKRTGQIRDDTFVAVGYGGVPGFPPSVIEFDLFRRFAISPYQGLNRNNLHLQQNPNVDDAGGTCFGDSGGPHFWEDTLLLVSVTSWGDAICRANDMTQRTDLEPALDFIASFLTP